MQNVVIDRDELRKYLVPQKIRIVPGEARGANLMIDKENPPFVVFDMGNQTLPLVGEGAIQDLKLGLSYVRQYRIAVIEIEVRGEEIKIGFQASLKTRRVVETFRIVKRLVFEHGGGRLEVVGMEAGGIEDILDIILKDISEDLSEGCDGDGI